MAYATRETAYAEREAAARQLDEGKLFVQMLAHRLGEAQRKLDTAEDQINTTNRLVASDATSPLVCRRLRENAMLEARIRRWGSEVATTQAGDNDTWSEEDQQSVVSHLSAEDAEGSRADVVVAPALAS
jgi:hypothetical protein